MARPRRFQTIAMQDEHATTAYRVDRRMRLPAFVALQAGIDPHAVLDALSVAFFGVGAVGFQAMLNIVRLQIARLALVDPDSFSLENIATQGIAPADVGKPKAIVAGERAKAISPRTDVQAFVGRLESLSDDELLGFDIIVLSTDNLHAESEAAVRCRRLGITLITAAVVGEMLTVQVKCYANASPQSPCICCGFGDAEWEHIATESKFKCYPPGSVVDAGEAVEVTTPPTMSVAGLSCMAGDLATITLLRKVLCLGDSVDDTYVEYCGYTHETVCLPLEVNAACPANHAIYQRCPIDQSIVDMSINDLLAVAGVSTPAASRETENQMRGDGATGATGDAGDAGDTGATGGTGACLAGEEKEAGHAQRVEEEEIFRISIAKAMQAFARGGPQTSAGSPSIAIDGHVFAPLQYCRCDEPRPLGRFVADGETLHGCAACGTAPTIDPLLPAFVPIALLESVVGLDGTTNRSLRDLGVTDVRSVKVRARGDICLIEGNVKASINPGAAADSSTPSVALPCDQPSVLAGATT